MSPRTTGISLTPDAVSVARHPPSRIYIILSECARPRGQRMADGRRRRHSCSLWGPGILTWVDATVIAAMSRSVAPCPSARELDRGPGGRNGPSTRAMPLWRRRSTPATGAAMKSSDVSGFYKKTPEDRWQIIRSFGELSDAEVETIRNTGALKFDQVDRMIENVVGAMPIPLGIAVNFRINERDYLVPMAIEEPSVVAAASNSAKMARAKGGFRASTSGPIMIGQVQLVRVPDPHSARLAILHERDEILRRANEKDPILVKLGGGAKDVEVRVIPTSRGPMVVTHLLVDTRDAMGANAVNTMAEAVAPYLEEITGGRVYLRIISNLAVKRLARARAVYPKDAIGGPDVVEGILEAFAFADADPFRCATHNKGIMNGIDAVVIATGNDFRAVEAGAHAYAAWKSGGYHSLTTWERNATRAPVGTIEVPRAVGLV